MAMGNLRRHVKDKYREGDTPCKAVTPTPSTANANSAHATLVPLAYHTTCSSVSYADTKQHLAHGVLDKALSIIEVTL